MFCIIFHGLTAPSEPWLPQWGGFFITLIHATLGRKTLGERLARRRDLYKITHNIQKRQTFMTPTEFETAIPVSELAQTQALNRAATEICKYSVFKIKQDNQMLFKNRIIKIYQIPRAV
jgi:hypothetical protein